MTPIIDELVKATAVLAAVARLDRTGLADADLVKLLRAEEVAGRFVDASRVFSAGEIADRSRYELGIEGLSMRFGERKPVNFVEQVTRVSQREAARRVRVGMQVRPRTTLLGEVLPPERPIVAEALANGLIGIDTAAVIVSSIKQAERGSLATLENLDAAELELVKQGTIDSADLVADAGRAWRDALDPDGIEPRWVEIQKHRLFTLGREHHGVKDATLHMTPILSAAIEAALEDSMNPGAGPRFLSEEDQANAETELVEVSGRTMERLVDRRTLGQKQYDIIEGVLLAGLAATRDGEPNFRTIGSITAIINSDDLVAGTGFGIIEGIDEVVPASVIKQIACSAPVTTIVLGTPDQPVLDDYLIRFFTREHRRRIIARDGDRCIARGCRKRASQVHAHHVVFFVDGGPTTVGNGVLLCPAHHHALHQGVFEIRMIGGMPFIRDRVDRFDETAWWPASRNRLKRPKPPG